MARFAVLLTLAAVVLALPAEGSTVPVKVKNTSVIRKRPVPVSAL